MRETNNNNHPVTINKNLSPPIGIRNDETCCDCFFSLFSTHKSEERPIIGEMSAEQLIQVAGMM